MDRSKVRVDVKGSQFFQPLFEFSGACARMRRDAVYQAAHAIDGRSAAGRQRDGLLVDLRRQSADHAVLHELAKAAARRGAIRSLRTTPNIGLGMRLAVDQNAATGRESVATALPSSIGRRTGQIDSGSRSDRASRELPRNGSGSSHLRQKLASLNGSARGRACLRRWPITWFTRASGSSAVTDGRMTSGTAGWITSWPPARM